MDYDYGQQAERQFEGNLAAFDAGEGEEEQGEDYYEGGVHRRREEDIGSGGTERQQSVNLQSSSSSAGKLFVGGLSWDSTEESFSSYFSQYGEITDAVIMMDRNSGRPRGFGFVTFADPTAADRVLEEEHVIDGRPVEVKRTVPKGDMEAKGVVVRAKKIFIGGIPPSLTEDELKEYFSVYGNIVDHQIMLDHKTGRSRGFGFVTFESEDAVEQIFSEGKTHELGGKQVEIKKAEPKRAGGGDYASGSKSYAGFNNRASGYAASNSSGSQYGGKMGRGYDGYGSYGGYGGFGGAYAGNPAAGFYGSYGGYGYGFGFSGPMMYGAGGYGSGYGNFGYYSNGVGHGGGSKGHGRNGENGGNGKGFGYGSAVSGGYGGSANGGGGGAVSSSRYHPYRK